MLLYATFNSIKESLFIEILKSLKEETTYSWYYINEKRFEYPYIAYGLVFSVDDLKIPIVYACKTKRKNKFVKRKFILELLAGQYKLKGYYCEIQKERKSSSCAIINLKNTDKNKKSAKFKITWGGKLMDIYTAQEIILQYAIYLV